MATAEAAGKSANEMIIEAMLQGYTWKQFTNVTEEQVEALYALAYRSFNLRQYDKAERVFQLLSSLDHYDARHLIGIGACRQKCKNYERAIDAYSAAGLIDMKNPVPALRAAECHLALGDREKAELGAKAALHWAGDDPAHTKWKERAELIMKGLENRKAKEARKAKEEGQ